MVVGIVLCCCFLLGECAKEGSSYVSVRILSPERQPLYDNDDGISCKRER